MIEHQLYRPYAMLFSFFFLFVCTKLDYVSLSFFLFLSLSLSLSYSSFVEVDRVHQQHWILRHAFQCNFHAPVEDKLKEGITVLDSGCGPATWTFEVGEAYPQSRIYGVDASCVFPENVKPANVEFAIGNIAKHIPHEDCTFDYIHQRLLIMGLTDEDWKNALKEHYRVLKPGGYIESVEVNFNNMETAGPYTDKIHKAFKIVTERRGVVLNIAQELKDRFTQAGFENIVQKIVGVPFNHSGKIGQLMWDDFRELCSSIRPALIGANPDLQGEGVFDHCLSECGREATEFKTYVEFYIVYGQKPSL
ncbi:S-adenosyl-L-methionine-dependent methyltransferase [Choanephora cucurbitarum]|nr:S-adenosyl-L-methionine-dependent methyltransferase [Choanephora cucurbitarum]